MDSKIIDRLLRTVSPDGFAGRSVIETGYPLRKLADNSLVTRVAPSPTGFVHLGTVYAALINYRLARQTSGIFILRIEDTDKKREVSGAQQQIMEALSFFGLPPDEGPAKPATYGPYVQSQRRPLYVSYVAELLFSGRAYPCFATPEELQEIYSKQRAAKQRPGYYGEYALWRERPNPDIQAALDAGKPFVLRFRSNGSHDKKIEFKDELKGTLLLPENDLDVPLLKSDGLPTYHLAHVVDDHLMRTNLVLRGEEWLPSVPLHIELAQALDLSPFNYAHFAPISILDNGNKRKLSKRKDPQADLSHWQRQGYPAQSILTYLTTLASSDYEAWRAANPFAKLEEFELKLSKLAMSRAPLLDEKKLDDISRDVVADLPQVEYERLLLDWVEVNDNQFYKQFKLDPSYTSKVLAIEREGANRRKDITKWSMAREFYFYFFDELYDERIEGAIKSELGMVDVLTQKAACQALLATYNPSDDQPTWLGKFRAAAESSGFAPDSKSFAQQPDSYKGGLADFAKIIRVRLATKNQTPDLYTVMQILGEDRVRARLNFSS